ncbi:MAG: hypothetical protein IJV04_04635 [Lachnospiraceae bacterium]|nr:hypothetical protein [Lachnospiraceae bacterium]
MENKKENKDNIIEFKGNSHFNIGIVICVIIFIYVVFRLFNYLTTEQITIYEVKDGSIVSDHTYRALILRDEEIVTADMDGYVYYFAASGGRVGVKSLIYAVDETGSIINNLLSKTGKRKKITGDYFSLTENEMASFVNEYTGSSFQKTYTFKDHLLGSLNALRVDSIMAKHGEEIEAAQMANTYHSYYPGRPGIISYIIDGLEKTTIYDFDPAVFDKALEDNNIKTKTEIKKGEPAYKLIVSDDWNLVLPIDSELQKELGSERNVHLNFESDGNSAWASVSYTERNDTPYLVLSMDDSMERYSDLRFVNVEITLDEKKGLKIPNSSVVQKEFFVIPRTYFLQGENSRNMGVLVKGEGGEQSFVSPTVYKETKNAFYIDDSDVKEGDVLVAPDSVNTYTVGSKRQKLKGVFSINKGYAVFKRIEPIEKNEDYTIIRTDTLYGIALFDRIVLQGDKVKENQIIY